MYVFRKFALNDVDQYFYIIQL